ncbi:MAG TPA: hypothetical protein VJ757_02025 [Pseudonocardiaceae bacterium]|nr:hypothetical protein [Pseudonocardiaceae bacterium]
MWTAQRSARGTSRDASRVPDQLPILQRGRHRRPEDGACVMEYVSVLAGSSFTDHPRCTHPALATLARLVNDWIDDDQSRSELALLAPDLIGTGAGDLRTTHRVVATCLSAAAAVRPLPLAASAQLARSTKRIRELERGGRWARVRLTGWQLLNPAGVMVGSAFQVVIAQLRGLSRREQNVRLRTLLSDAVTDCHRMLDGHSPGHRVRGSQLSERLP